MKKLKVYRTGVLGQIKTLHPYEASAPEEKKVIENCFDPLLKVNPQTQMFEGCSASNAQLASDGQSALFFLKPNLVWSDGSRITAHDYRRGLLKILSPHSTSSYKDQLFFIKGAQEYAQGHIMLSSELGIEVINDLTFKISLRSPYADFLHVFSRPWLVPLAQDMEKQNRWNLKNFKNWKSNGPYVPKRMNAQALLLQRNPRYQGCTQPRIDEVTFYQLASMDEGLEKFAAGDLHQLGYQDAGVPVLMASNLANKGQMIYQEDLRTLFLRLNAEKFPLSSSDVRQALAMIIHRPMLVDAVGLSGFSSAFSLMPKGVYAYEPAQGYLYSVARAKKLMHLAGYCFDEKKEKCKTLSNLELVYEDRADKQKIALTLETLFKKYLGLISVRLKPLSSEAFETAIKKGDYVLALDDVSVSSEVPFALLEHFFPGKPTAGTFSDPRYEEYLQKAFASRDQKRAHQFYRQAESLLLDSAEVVPLLYGTTPMLLSPQVEGFTPNIWDVHPISELDLKP